MLLLLAATLLTAPGAASAPGDLGGIPPERLTVWAPGVPGGVPERTAVCANLEAAPHGDGASDASAAIQAALDACPPGQVVRLGPGRFKVNHTLRIRKGVVLRGAGPDRTHLAMDPGIQREVVLIGVQWPKLTGSTRLVADGAKGARSVEVADARGLVPGEIVLVDQLTDPALTLWSPKSPPGSPSRAWFTRPERPLGQVMEVAAVEGNRVTFTTPFHVRFATASAAELTRYVTSDGGVPAAAVRLAGLEDLHVVGGGNGNVRLSLAAHSWVRNVESELQVGESVALDHAFRCTVRDSFLHHTRRPEPGGGGYGLAVSWYSADNLIENNVVWRFNKVMVMRASGGGNVVAYNYMDDGYISYDPGWVEVGLNASHMTTPHFELFEGNQSFNFDGDNTWGNAVYVTVFRNHLTGARRSAGAPPLQDRSNRRAIGLMAGHWWYSFVGNVLGTPGMSPAPARRLVYESTWPWSDDPVGLWRLGYDPEDWKARPDGKVLATVLRDGNFDMVTGEVRWAAGPHPLPDSLYLTAKPAFFGDLPWPWVDPAGPVKVRELPARRRFEALLR